MTTKDKEKASKQRLRNIREDVRAVEQHVKNSDYEYAHVAEKKVWADALYAISMFGLTGTQAQKLATEALKTQDIEFPEVLLVSVRDQVLAAGSPKEALLVLADAIDNLQTADPWDSWDSEPEIDAEESEITDGSTGQPLKGGPFTQWEESGVEDLDFPPPTAVQEQIRRTLVDYLGFENMQAVDDNGNKYNINPSEEEIAQLEAAFVKAGPVWLYLTHRDHLLELPMDVRRRMVDDVEYVDPRYAYNMGKDILMFRDQGDNSNVLPVRTELTGAID